jgi:hypothetical protein
VNSAAADGTTALHWVPTGTTRDGGLPLAPAPPDAQTDPGVTPLYLASEIAGAQMVKLLAAGEIQILLQPV